jgi:hypothetical protein
LAWLFERAATDLALIQQDKCPDPHYAPVAAGFPLQGLDHFAAVAHDLDVKTPFWTDVLGVPVAGEVTTPAMVIRQFRIGDAVMELLEPASADSPIDRRPPGLVSMVAWEVDNLSVAVHQARTSGFTVPDAPPGVVPETRTETISTSDLAGAAMP